MEMYYLVLGLWTYSAIIIPEKYTLDECEKAGSVAAYHRCIPAPKNYYNCAYASPDPADHARGVMIKAHCEPPTGKP